MKNKVRAFPGVFIEKWRFATSPTLEITTSIPAKGCVVDCVFCPQRVLEKAYQSDIRTLTFDNFKVVIDKLPKNIRITFAGFTEPWLNRNTTDMLIYAHEQGHPIAVFTTGIGMNLSDVERIKNIPFDLGPNGGFVLHLPDKERLAKHPITPRYLEVLAKIRSVAHEIQGFQTMSMGDIHADVEPIFNASNRYDMWSRSGNLIGEAMLKPELLNIKDRFKTIYHGEGDHTCNCKEKLYHNIILPDGRVSLCCMDYGLKVILGNLFTQDYEEILPKPFTCYDMCRFCENGIKADDPSLDNERRYILEDEDPTKLEWGSVGRNRDFKRTVLRQVFEQDDYQRFFKVEKGDVVFDVGASVGAFSWHIAKKQPAVIHAFEPHVDSYDMYTKNMAKFPNLVVRANNAGIMDVTGTIDFPGMFDPDSFAMHSGKGTGNAVQFNDYIAGNAVEKIDFLKTDCEGGEYAIFNDQNFAWIAKNVKKVAGEFHLHDPIHKEKFRRFRDTYLRAFPNHQILAMNGVDIKWDLWNDSFINFYMTIMVYFTT